MVSCFFLSGVPCLFLALLVLFRYYSAYDIWTSNGVHLVYLPDESQNDLETGDNDDDTDYDQTNITNIGEDTTLIATNDESFDGVIPNAESTTLSNGDTISNNEVSGWIGLAVSHMQDQFCNN